MQAAGEALDREPGTLGEETAETVLAKGVNLLVRRAEEHRAQGHQRKFFDYIQACEFLLIELTRREPDEARWHYYYALQHALLGDSSDLTRALEEVDACLRCSNAATYKAPATRLRAYCQAEQKRQKEAQRRIEAAIARYLQTHGSQGLPLSSSDYVPCDCRHGFSYSKGAGGCPACR